MPVRTELCYTAAVRDASRHRASARANWPGALTNLVEQRDAGIVTHGTPAERIAMVWRITQDVWASSGQPLPSYTRANMPGRIVRAEDD